LDRLEERDSLKDEDVDGEKNKSGGTLLDSYGSE
jgi:hypothetical protein